MNSFSTTGMRNETWAVIPAAGSGSRLAGSGIDRKKQFLEYQGFPLFWHSVLALAKVTLVKGVVLVFPDKEYTASCDLCRNLTNFYNPGIAVLTAVGGARRQDSVRCGLKTLPSNCGRVLVHDAARPFLQPSLVTRLLKTMDAGASAAVPGLPLADTVKQVKDSEVVKTLDRSSLRSIQTPQAFDCHELLRVHARAETEDWEVTDDASMFELAGQRVEVVEGDPGNIKITTENDLQLLYSEQSMQQIPCSGFGYDVHRYGGPRPMILGGVPIAGGPGIYAHSDGDVLLHALGDALLGCCAKGDIGRHFPDTDQKFENMSSAVLITEILDMVAESEVEICHVDLTVVAQKPRLAHHADQIRESVARLLVLKNSQVNFKATTEEKLGFTGEMLGIKAMAIVSGLKKTKQS